jgi:hypothetical protein
MLVAISDGGQCLFLAETNHQAVRKIGSLTLTSGVVKRLLEVLFFIKSESNSES